MNKEARHLCAGCGKGFTWAKIELHQGRPYCGWCIGLVDGTVAAALAENKWDHEFDPRPNSWWPEETA